MPNIIEIITRNTTDKPSFDAAKAQAAATAAEIDAIMAAAGKGGAGESVTVVDIPAAAPLEDVSKGARDAGVDAGDAFSRSFSTEASKGLSDTALLSTSLRSIGTEGDPVGRDFAVKFSQAAKDGITQSSVSAILAPDGPVAAKIDADAKTTGEKAGKDSGEGMSKVMAAALVAGAAIGPAAILTGMAAAATGATALILKSNATIAADYQKVGADGAAAIKAAAAPLAGDLHQSLTSIDASLKGLEPDLKTAFAGAGPDIATLTTGLESLASNALPGIGASLAASQADVVGFSAGLGPLGAGIGSFFTGLTRDSATTGAGLQSVMGVVGNTFGTLGTVVGSASSAVSADLMAVDPVVNTFLTTIRGLASPATIGGLAGAFAAMKLDPSISTGLGNMATKLTTFASESVDAEGGMTKIGSAANSMGGSLSKASGIMGGPWGIAIGAGIGLASGLAGSLIQAAHASDALSLSQQGLSDAIAKDGGNAGQATAAYVAQSDAANGLTASASKAGVSVTTWTQAVMGNKQAQSDVTAAVDKLNQAQLGQMTTAAANANVTSHAMGDLQGGTVTVLAHSQAVNKLTSSNQQLLASMTTQATQIASDITKQAELTQATNALNSSTAIFNATMSANYQAMVQSATTSADNSVAALNLGTSQTTLNQKLAAGITQYQLLTGAAGGYQTVLTSLNGATMTADQAQNTLAQDMVTARASFKQNGESLDLNTQSGINNRQALVAAAQAITALGVANMSSGGNINSANRVIQDQITDFVNATGATREMVRCGGRHSGSQAGGRATGRTCAHQSGQHDGRTGCLHLARARTAHHGHNQ